MGLPARTVVVEQFVLAQQDSADFRKYARELQRREGTLDGAGVLQGILDQRYVPSRISGVHG